MSSKHSVQRKSSRRKDKAPEVVKLKPEECKLYKDELDEEHFQNARNYLYKK